MSYPLLLLSLGQTLVSARDFPVHVKLSDWQEEDGGFNDLDVDVKTYRDDMIMQSGGGGILIAVVLTAVMLVCLFLFWCCPCCCFHECCLCCRKQEKLRWSKKTNKRVGCGLMSLALLCSMAGAGLLFPSTGQAIDDGQEAIDNMVVTIDDGMEFFCGDPLMTALIDGEDYDTYTAGKSAQQLCQDATSLSGFLTDTDCKVNYTMESVHAYIDGLTDIIVALDTSVFYIGQAKANVTALRTVVTDLKVTSDELGDTLAELNGFRFSIDSDTVPRYNEVDVDVPVISDQDIADLDSAIDNIDDAQTQMNDAKESADETITNDLQTETASEIDEESREITDQIEELQENVLDYMETMSDTRKDTNDFNDMADEWRTTIIACFVTFYGLCTIFLCIALIGFCVEWACIVKLAGVCMLLTMGVMCVSLGFTIVVYYFTGDMCEVLLVGTAKSNGLGLFQVNLEGETVDFGNVTINMSTTVNAILTCAGGCSDILSSCGDPPNPLTTSTGCDASNNLVDIMGLSQEFNFSENVAGSIEKINSFAPSLNYSTEIADARAQIDSPDVTSALTNDLADSYNATAVHVSIALLKSVLPICNTRDGCMTDDLTSSECDLWDAVWDQDDCTCTALLVTASDGVSVKSYYDWNCDLVALVDDTHGHAIQSDVLIAGGTAAQEGLTVSLDRLGGALTEIDNVIEQKQEALTMQSELLAALVDYIIEEAPGHFSCEWISDAFDRTIETDYCENAYNNIRAIIPGMGLSIFGMLVGFFTMLEIANPNRSLLDEQQQPDTKIVVNWQHPAEHRGSGSNSSAGQPSGSGPTTGSFAGQNNQNNPILMGSTTAVRKRDDISAAIGTEPGAFQPSDTNFNL